MPFLDWVNKAQAQRTTADVPYHLLQFQSAHGDPQSENLLIQGDNLLALKALLPFYRGRVKCIFIDPPYNTQSAFEHYDDKLEHSQWLSMMWPRLVLLRELLAEDGSIWVSIDDREAHYLRVLMDETFGRINFLSNVIWRSSDNSNNDAKTFSVDHNHILVYSRKTGWLSNKLDAVEKRSHFKNPDNDPRGAWFDGNPLNSPAPRENLTYDITAPNGYVIHPPANGWRWEPETLEEKMATGEIRFNSTMTGIIRRTYLEDMKGLPPSTLWIDLLKTGHNRQAKSEQKKLTGDSKVGLFATPKPEKLIQEILLVATAEGDIILDSYLGSGTTAAVAHKMGRRFIGIEMGDHAQTHCLPRLEKVIEGEQGGISKSVEWKGGGGFRFHTLGEPVFDADGGIHPAVRFAALAAYLWHFETGNPARQTFDSPLMGVYEGTAYVLLYNGILGDRRPAGGNVLTVNVLAHIDALFPHAGPRVVYGETTRLGEARLREGGITFKQIPYDIKAR